MKFEVCWLNVVQDAGDLTPRQKKVIFNAECIVLKQGENSGYRLRPGMSVEPRVKLR